MTATDPRLPRTPIRGPAAKLAAGLATAAEATAAACAEDMSAGPDGQEAGTATPPHDKT